ncbi:type II toxin-antitoxin system HicB family antitoxin [Aeromonas sobria]|uniref:type II toxin-antitoxin system HicB family antitoxin n=1 Tax=Aeromonas sobria TaxID=646 RepID=UPI001652738F|nr:type II toxin-antitoxin system HicB family antitoxin [Aeromonas sobria]
MNNRITINGYNAVYTFDEDIGMYRGEFVGLNGGADFYANNIPDLKDEGAISLKVFLEVCEEKGIVPNALVPKNNKTGVFRKRVKMQRNQQVPFKVTFVENNGNSNALQFIRQAVSMGKGMEPKPIALKACKKPVTR